LGLLAVSPKVTGLMPIISGEVRLEGKVVHRFQVDFDIVFRYTKSWF
jgi:hypothetical protein